MSKKETKVKVKRAKIQKGKKDQVKKRVKSTINKQKKLKKQFMQNMRINRKFISGFGVIIALIIALALLSSFNVYNTSKNINTYKIVADIQSELNRGIADQIRYEVSSDPGAISDFNTSMFKTNTKVSDLLLVELSEENQVGAEAIKAAIDSYKLDFDQYVSVEEQKQEQAQISNEFAKVASDKLIAALEEIEEYMLSLDDAEDILETYSSYVDIQVALENMLQVNTAALNYINTESSEHASILVESMDVADEMLSVAYSDLFMPGLTTKVYAAIDALADYRETFTTYESLVNDQKTIISSMRNNTTNASFNADNLKLAMTESLEKLEATSMVFNIAISISIIVISVMAAVVITRTITKPLKEAIGSINEVADYDLTHEVSPALLSRKDEFGHLGKAIQQIGENLKLIIGEISDSSTTVASNAEQLAATSHQVSDTSKEVARTIEEIARGAGEQASSTESGALNISELGELLAANKAYVNNLNTAALEVGQLKDDGLSILEDLVEKTKLNSEASKTVHEIVRETSTSAEKISTASEMIRSIASQTNLLALNAAIEAARAGEAGRGFAVVADEIRKLAEQTNSFTQAISNDVNELIDKASMAVHTMEDMEELVDLQAQGVETTNEKFTGIANAVDEMKTMIDTINESSMTMDSKRGNITAVIENLSAISQENAASTQEAAASMEEQATSMSEIAGASSDLSELAENMQRSVSKFKL